MKNPKCLVLVVEDDSLIAFDTGAQIEQALAVHDRLAIVRLAQACGVSVVIGTVLDEARNGIAGLRDVPVLVKPYDPVRLVETVESRLAAIHPCRGLTEQMPAL